MTSFQPSATFYEAASYLSRLPTSSQSSYVEKLELYGIYKFLTVAPVPQTPRPSLLAYEGRAKWDSWNSMASLWGNNEIGAEERYKAIAQRLGWNEALATPSPVLAEATIEELLAAHNDNSSSPSQTTEGVTGVTVSAMAPPDGDDDGPPLHKFAISGDSQGLSKFLECNPDQDINGKDAYGYTPLHLASDRGNENSVRILLTHGADMFTKDADGFLPIDLAREASHSGIVSLLETTAK